MRGFYEIGKGKKERKQYIFIVTFIYDINMSILLKLISLRLINLLAQSLLPYLIVFHDFCRQRINLGIIRKISHCSTFSSCVCFCVEQSPSFDEICLAFASADKEWVNGVGR